MAQSGPSYHLRSDGGQPLLSNIALDEFDRELERRGLRSARYADDCSIYVRRRRAGDRVMKIITRFITTKLKLKVNGQKSAVGGADRRDLPPRQGSPRSVHLQFDCDNYLTRSASIGPRTTVPSYWRLLTIPFLLPAMGILCSRSVVFT
jgi:hypothetical protein